VRLKAIKELTAVSAGFLFAITAAAGVRLGAEPAYRGAMRRGITEASAVLFDGVAAVRAAGRCLQSAAYR
jgi:hypothetical protein